VSTAGTASSVVALNPFAFEGLEAADIDGLRANGIERFCDPSLDFPCLLEAPVELSSGVTVTRLELDAFDAGATDLKVNFYRCPPGTGACDLLAEVSTDGASGASQVGADLVDPETIDNSNFTYLVEVYPGEDELTRLTGVRLAIEGAESRTRAETLSLHAYAFEGRTHADRAALRAQGIQRYCEDTACDLTAPIELPTGSTVRRIELDAFDSGAGEVAATLSKCDPATGLCTPIESVGTTGTPGATQPGADLLVPEVIENASYSYVVETTLGPDSTTRLLGVRLGIDPGVAPPRHDTLSINPFAFEGEAAADNAVLGSQDGERFCAGQGCTMLAPVELPTGTRIGRFDLSAWDMSGDQVQAALLRCAKSSGTCEEVATLATAGTSGATATGIEIVPPAAVDNAAFTYSVKVESGPNADTALRGVSLTIENSSIFDDGFGGGGTAAWSRTVS
jgi:hypothetical protein